MSNWTKVTVIGETYYALVAGDMAVVYVKPQGDGWTVTVRGAGEYFIGHPFDDLEIAKGEARELLIRKLSAAMDDLKALEPETEP